MFDHNNLVCRLFVAYMLEATHTEYSSEGALYITNRFYDFVEKFQEYADCYQRAAKFLTSSTEKLSLFSTRQLYL